MKRLPTRRLALRAGLTVLASLAGASRGGAAAAAETAPALRVGSKIDTEGSLLGQLIIQALQANGIRTENRLQLGTTKIVRSALIAGEIDIYPEYTGNGAFFFADEKNPAWKNRRRATSGSRRSMPRRTSWSGSRRRRPTTPGRSRCARTWRSSTSSSRWPTWRAISPAAGSSSSPPRPNSSSAPTRCRRSRRPTASSSRRTQLLTLAGGDTAATDQGRGRADLAASMPRWPTAPTAPVAALGLVILDDPKGVQPVYAPAPMVRAECWQRQPKIADAAGAGLRDARHTDAAAAQCADRARRPGCGAGRRGATSSQGLIK